MSRIYVDGGTGGNLPNAIFADIKVCVPGTTQCVVIDHMLVDTGSVGARFFASALPANMQNALPQYNSDSGALAGECLTFASGSTWGGVRQADVYMAGSTLDSSKAAAIPVHVIGDTDPRLATIPSTCSMQGSTVQTAADLGGKGILGIGVFAEDCGSYCVSSKANVYYNCPSAGACVASTMQLSSQVPNPVAKLSSDNNGSIIVLPGLPGGSARALEGMLIFGIGTRSNNALAAGSSVLGTTGQGVFTSVFNGRTLPKSFLDSGSTVNFLPSGGAFPLPACPAPRASFLCPATDVTLDAANTGRSGTSSLARVFISNANNAFAAHPGDRAVAGLAGGIFASLPDALDLGATFMFGRATTTLIENRSAAGFSVSGPAFAHTP